MYAAGVACGAGIPRLSWGRTQYQQPRFPGSLNEMIFSAVWRNEFAFGESARLAAFCDEGCRCRTV